MSPERFLSRWSRRKQEVRKTEPPPEDAPSPQLGSEASEAAPNAVVPQDGAGPPGPTEANLGADDTLALPSLEDLTADMDLSMFLREGVPEPLRNAALRRMWSLDPKIRDFVCEAREYAYDWNTPGGVPGYGPLPSTEDILRMAARIVGGEPSDGGLPDAAEAASTHAQAITQSQDRGQPSSSGAGTGDASAAVPHQDPVLMSENESPRIADETSVRAPVSSLNVAMTRRSDKGAEPDRTEEPVTPAPRRHGGAMPL